jgi:hypothetical protein
MFHIRITFYTLHNNIGDVMVSVLVSNEVDSGIGSGGVRSKTMTYVFADSPPRSQLKGVNAKSRWLEMRILYVRLDRQVCFSELAL